MTHKIYHIQNIDTGKGYVGITSGELGMRWYQHMHDPQSAIYKALRSDGHRMTMNLLEECEDRNEALAKEQQYIRELNTAQPNGWNRRVSSEIAKPKPKAKIWKRCEGSPKVLELGYAAPVLVCPACYYDGSDFDGHHLHQGPVQVFFRGEFGTNTRTSVAPELGCYEDDNMENNPSSKRDGIRIEFVCEQCHWGGTVFELDTKSDPPPYELLIFQHKGNTFFEWVYYVEDKS